MLLAIDVGNTETVIGLFGPAEPDAPDAMGFARAHRRARAGLPLAALDVARAHARRARHGR